MGLERPPENGGERLSVNVGSDTWNYQVRDLANAVAEAVPGTTVSVNPNAQPDTRSYKVDFSLYRELAPRHQPQITLQRSVEMLRDGLTAMGFAGRRLSRVALHAAEDAGSASQRRPSRRRSALVRTLPRSGMSR